MAITIHFLTVVIRIDSIEKKYPGGINAFMKRFTSWRDYHLVGVGFMSLWEAEDFIYKLIKMGFSNIFNGESGEIAIVEQLSGSPCKWLETNIEEVFLKKVAKVTTCWLKGCDDKDLGISLGKNYDPSLWEDDFFKA
ncbi:MAG: hypothetical protein A4E71_02560 [Smithella sp. PtaU1.Bin162]|nr:MAG: hypothetical protein A4E71_02560 [Smithella sp. PtaU1.Bin162]